MEAVLRPWLVVHTVARPEASASVSRLAADVGGRLFDALTRPRGQSAAAASAVAVRVATAPEQIRLDEADHVVLVPFLDADWGSVPTPSDSGTVTVLEGETRGGAPSSWTSASLMGTPDHDLVHRLVATLATTLLGDALALVLVADPDADAGLSDAVRASAAALGVTIRDAVDDTSLRVACAGGAAVVVHLRTDGAAERIGVRRALLEAKRLGGPVLEVVALQQGETHSAWMLGTTESVVVGEPASVDADGIVARALAMAVRAAAFRVDGVRSLQLHRLPAATAVLSRPPDPADLADLSRGALVLHPDPELSPLERFQLHRIDPRLRLVTPTTAAGKGLGGPVRSPLDGVQVALSISDQPDPARADGTTREHRLDVLFQVCRALLGAGASLAYGGDLRPGGYTTRLMDLVHTYDQSVGGASTRLHWHLAPDLVPPGQSPGYSVHPFPQPLLGLTALPPELAASRRFSALRQRMARITGARVVLGGNTEPAGRAGRDAGYGGPFPGVVEEAWRALTRTDSATGAADPQPLFVLGGFGGAAAVVAALLRGEDTPAAMREASWADVPRFRSLVEAHRRAEPEASALPGSMDAMADEIRARGRALLDAAGDRPAWNGLTRAENEQLFATRDPARIAALVLRGLLRWHAAGIEPRGARSVELVRGDIAGATGLDVVIVPTFDNEPLGGAGGAIDRVTGGAATRSRDEGLRHAPGERVGVPQRVVGGGVGADHVLAARLPKVLESGGDVPGAVSRTAAAVVEAVARYGFRRVGLVGFLGNVDADTATWVVPLAEALQRLPPGSEVVWFEADGTRFSAVAELLDREAPRLGLVVSKRVAVDADRVGPASEPAAVLDVAMPSTTLRKSLLLPRANALAPWNETAVPEETRDALVEVTRGERPSADAVEAAGAVLADVLFPGGGTDLAEALTAQPLLVSVDVPGARLPFEALRLRGVTGAAAHPALMGGVVRRLSVSGPLTVGVPVARPARVPRVLLVVDPLGRPGRPDLRSAVEEGALVEQLLRDAGVEVKVLRFGAATVSAVVDVLKSGRFDVFHYCGHAFFSATGAYGSGLRLAADEDLTLAHLEGLSDLPRVAILNACRAARLPSKLPAAKDGPQPAVPRARSFADFFLRSGVQAYLGTTWDVSDTLACDFARVFYERLLGGATLGEAVVQGRRALFQKGTQEWANYVLYGDADVRVSSAGFSSGRPTGP